MSSSASFTGDGGAQRVFASQAIWAGSVSAGRCVVTLFLCPALITAAAFLTLYTLLWWRWSRITSEPDNLAYVKSPSRSIRDPPRRRAARGYCGSRDGCGQCGTLDASQCAAALAGAMSNSTGFTGAGVCWRWAGGLQRFP